MGSERPDLGWAERHGLVTQGDWQAWAVTSADDVYRYALGRFWDDYAPKDERPFWERGDHRHLICFCMLNPSKARHDVPDPTMRKCVGFAKKHGAGGIIIVNLFAFSTPYPTELRDKARSGFDVVGPANHDALDWATSRPALLGRNIAAWGKIPKKLYHLTMNSRFHFNSGECFGKNGDGSPKHPLMLGYDTPIVKMNPPLR